MNPETVMGGKCQGGDHFSDMAHSAEHYAQRSKQALCLPQRIPNRAYKVPPLCDPDPLLIMDRLQKCPLGDRASALQRADKHMRHVQLNAERQPQTNRGWQEVGFFSPLLHFDSCYALYCHEPFQSVFCCCVYLITQETGACSTKARNNCQVLENPFQFFDSFCWNSNARDLAPSWTYPFFLCGKAPHICDCFKFLFVLFSKFAEPPII